MRVLFLSLLILFSPLLSAELYKWVDEKGNTHFSDKPLDKTAEPYTPPPIQTVPAGPTGSFESTGKMHIPVKYETVRVISPSNDQVFLPDTEKISVGIQVKPPLDVRANHQIAIYLDGVIVKQGQSMQYSSSNLPRGTHTAAAAIFDEKGNQIIVSDTVSFHVKRHHR